MKTYIIYFEIGGHKMKSEVIAANEEAAVQKVRDRLTIHKAVQVETKGTAKLDEMIKDILGIVNKRT